MYSAYHTTVVEYKIFIQVACLSKRLGKMLCRWQILLDILLLTLYHLMQQCCQVPSTGRGVAPQRHCCVGGSARQVRPLFEVARVVFRGLRFFGPLPASGSPRPCSAP